MIALLDSVGKDLPQNRKHVPMCLVVSSNVAVLIPVADRA